MRIYTVQSQVHCCGWLALPTPRSPGYVLVLSVRCTCSYNAAAWTVFAACCSHMCVAFVYMRSRWSTCASRWFIRNVDGKREFLSQFWAVPSTRSDVCGFSVDVTSYLKPRREGRDYFLWPTVNWSGPPSTADYRRWSGAGQRTLSCRRTRREGATSGVPASLLLDAALHSTSPPSSGPVPTRGRREDASTPRPRRRPSADPGVHRKLLTFACRCWWNCRVLPGYVLRPCCCVCCVFDLPLFAAVLYSSVGLPPWG